MLNKHNNIIIILKSTSNGSKLFCLKLSQRYAPNILYYLSKQTSGFLRNSHVLAELLVDVLVHLLELLDGGLHAVLVRVYELHAVELVDGLEVLLLEAVEVDAVLDGAGAQLVEAAYVAHHQARLHERTVLVVRREAVLLQEALFDDLARLDDELLVVAQGVEAHELRRLLQADLVLQKLAQLVAEREELLVGLVEPAGERVDAARVGERPVDGREVLALREVLGERPEDLHDLQRVHGDGVGEITALRRDGADDGDGALPGLSVVQPEAADAARALVELRKPGREV